MWFPVLSSHRTAEVALAVAFLNLPFNVVYARVVTSEGDEAQITGAYPTVECTAYGWPAVTNALNEFPPIWQPATILANDTDAVNSWANISKSVPTDIIPHGDIFGDWNDTSYNVASDPACWWTRSLCTTPKLAGLPPDVASVPEPDTMGYGFDDGPNCSHNAFYDYLKDQNQKATMFFIGSNVLDWPLEAMRAIDEGHEICAHTWSHHYMTGFSSPDAFAELYYSKCPIKLVLGVTVTCWRPPFGDVDDRIRAIAEGLGLRTIIWQYDSFDWEQATGNVTAQQVYQNYDNFIQRAENGTFSSGGSIMLTHELNNFTMQTAVSMYPQLKDAFKYVVPIGVALNKTQPYVESNYSLPSFEQYISGTITTNSSGSSGSSSSNTSSSTSSNKNAAMTLATKPDSSFFIALGLLSALMGSSLLL
ncbi:carbohydrate esterase family 4 protein [Collybiopsis luxurians FD-317 M1]|uniref:chitin deacetylase n=1 Tax=Collybiopsis luxurians FD-317 M1 TaxID=944289 RepID=A0A0D0BCS2_9AGAR|nr:carbohydrate esterase family 4 protein [Collybiopsis luxurians FD-317 M1]